MKQKMVNFYMNVAHECSKLSYAKRLQVGCIIVKDNNITSFSWNGMPAGWDNNCEDEIYDEDGFHITLKTKPEVLHAERNALDKLVKQGGTGAQGSTLFCTHSPCLECAKSIYGTGIKKLYYRHQYRSSDGIDFLLKCGVDVEQLN